MADQAITEFVRRLQDPAAGCAVDFSAGTSTALVAFGGLGQGIGLPPFEFFTLLSAVPIAKIFLRDIDRAWYRKGVRGVADDAETTISTLRRLLDEHHIDRLICVGVSSGGYGALWYGTRLGADAVHAFSAQTTTRAGDRLVMADRRFRTDVRAMRRSVPARAGVRDVRPLVAAATGTEAHLHWGTRSRADGLHARRLRRLPHVHVHAYPGLGHADLTRSLRADGRLRQILLEATEPPVAAA